MNATMNLVKVTIQPEALTLAEKLGVREAMERLIEQMKAMVPQLLTIAVEVEIHPEDPTYPHMIAIDGVEARSARPATDLSVLNEYRRWVLHAIPREVATHFVYDICPRG